MKHYFIILALMLGVTCYSQGKDSYDLTARTRAVTNMVKSYAKSKSVSDAEAYAAQKLTRLQIAVELSDADKQKFTELFKNQYPNAIAAVDAYKDDKAAQAKVNLIKVLLEQEDQTRKLLTERQLIYYLSYWNIEYAKIDYIDFRLYFMPDHIYYGYKKELL